MWVKILRKKLQKNVDLYNEIEIMRKEYFQKP